MSDLSGLPKKHVPSRFDHNRPAECLSSPAFRVLVTRPSLPPIDPIGRIVTGMSGWDQVVSLDQRRAQKARLSEMRKNGRYVPC